MLYAYTQDVPIDRALYEKIVANLGAEPIDGLIVHLAVEREGGLRYIDVWESEEACTRAFEERIHPAVERAFETAGFQPTEEPATTRLTVVDLHVSGARPQNGKTLYQ